MAFALSTSASSTCRALQLLFSSTLSHNSLFSKPPPLVLPCHPLSPSTLAFSCRRNHDSSIKASSSSSSKKKNMKRRSLSREDEDEDDMEDDPFEKLFGLLEEDLKNDASTVDKDSDDEEINEEDIDKLAQELLDVLGDDDMELHHSATDGLESSYDDAEEEEEEEEKDEDEEEEDDDDDKEEFEVRLKNWQLKKLAYALKSGRRKVSIKNLAAELCLDRAIVIEMLRSPPPNLLMLSASLPDELPPVVSVPEVKLTETFTVETSIDAVKLEAKVKEPVHVRQHRWLALKRLKKVHVKTLEMVYRRSKRPTNAMISSIVQVTNLPRRRIVQWFEDKRAEEGVPERRAPYQRRQGSSGLVWHDTFFSGDLAHIKRQQEREAEPKELRHCQSDGSAGMVDKGQPNGGGIIHRTTRKVAPPDVDPPSPKVSGCFCFSSGKSASKKGKKKF